MGIYNKTSSRMQICAIVLLSAVLIQVWPVHAQSARTVRVSGRVVDAETQETLPGVHVFLSGTTRGTTTDNNGHFIFLAPRTRRIFDLVVSMVGYEVETKALSDGLLEDIELNISLHPETVELGEIVVTSSNRAWKRHLEHFKELLLSKTPNARRCRILNSEVLSFDYNEKANILQATTSEPLVIENRALGYTIILHDLSLGSTLTELSWGGGIQFRELDPESERQRSRWEDNRRRAYNGSKRHFLASLVAGNYTEQGFSVCLREQPVDDCWVISRDSLLTISEHESEEAVLRFSGMMYVVYNQEDLPRSFRAHNQARQQSHFSLLDDELAIDQKGYEITPWALKQYGYWAWERLAEDLPYDYMPK